MNLEQRFGECNGPLLYQIKREISSFSQGNAPVVVSFTMLKKLWDELTCLKPILICNCGASRVFVNIDIDDKLMQFLIGLNDSYDHV